MKDYLEPSVSLIIPFYNPGPYFRDHLLAVISVLNSSGLNFELIGVNDGSIDESDNVALSFSELTLISHSKNHGKGSALRTGFKAAQGQWIGFIDADGDLPASQLEVYFNLIKSGEAKEFDSIIATKVHSDSIVHSGILRRSGTKGFHLLTNALFHLGLDDTQTGLKFFRRELIESVIDQSTEDGFAIDVELLCLAKIHGFKRVKYVPAIIVKRHTSTISVKNSVKTLFDLFKLRRKITKIKSDSAK